MQGSSDTLSELARSTGIGAIVFPALIVSMALLYGLKTGFPLDLPSDATWHLIHAGVAAVFQGAVLGFAIGLAGLRSHEDPVAAAIPNR